jgi:DNA-binding HxlR family transcriptional regulator
MPKSFNIRLEVEEIGLGVVLHKLNEMPFVIRLHLDLERGGEGAGRKQLEDAAKAARGDAGEPVSTRILKLLMDGPKSVKELRQAIGGPSSRVYGATHHLRKQGLIEAGDGFGMHRLTHKAQAELGLVKALPAPSSPPIKHGPKGRAVKGSGNIVLKAILSDGPKSPSDLRALAGERGVSERSMSGVLNRAKRDGLIKKNGAGYVLTAKGEKIDMGGATHG